MPSWIWEHTGWPAFHWRETEISPVLARARLATAWRELADLAA